MNQPLSQAVTDNCWGNIRLLATDMDGTLTQQEKFTSDLLETLEELAAVGLQVLIVTGRSAGWVNGIAAYLPVVGAIAENGGILYWHNSNSGRLLTDIDDFEEHRQQLKSLFQLLKSKFPQIRESEDNRFRITDWTFDVEGLDLAALQQINNICLAAGWGFTYSTVQCHLKPLKQNKADALRQVIEKYFPNLKSEQIVTVGDSPNDESLFNPEMFPLSVGVANLADYRDRLKYFPKYLTSKTEGKGFCELAELVVKTNSIISHTV